MAKAINHFRSARGFGERFVRNIGKEIKWTWKTCRKGYRSFLDWHRSTYARTPKTIPWVTGFTLFVFLFILFPVLLCWAFIKAI